MAQQRRQINGVQFPDSLREMSRLRDIQHIGAGTRVCERGITGGPRREWENNLKFILKILTQA